MYFKVVNVSECESVAQHNVCGHRHTGADRDPFHRGACSRNPNQGTGALEPTLAGSQPINGTAPLRYLEIEPSSGQQRVQAFILGTYVCIM